MIEPLEIQVRFADIDSMGHVNNAVYLSYFENARMHYFAHLVGRTWDWKKDGIVLLRNEIDYVKPVLLHHRPKIEVRVDHIGTKSFSMSYELKVDGEIHCKGVSVLVAFDYTTQKSVEIPSDMRAALEEAKREQ